MRHFTLFILLSLFTLGIMFPACNGLDDDYSTNPNHRLSFSVDTLSFDTVFTTVGSATRQFMIYNRNKEPLFIESITLANADKTGFRMNVDGRKGNTHQDIYILEKDSMYVFVEVTVDPNNTNQPLLIRDSVVVTVNGVKQRVLLEAYGQDVYLHKGGTFFNTDTLLPSDKPHLIYDSLVVAPDVTVEITPGSVFYMHDKAKWNIHGTFVADGTLEAPIVFRGDRLDYILDETLPYDRVPAQWGGFFFYPESYHNRMNQVVIRNGLTGITCYAAEPLESKLLLSNAQITNMNGDVLRATNCRIDVINSELTNATDTAVLLIGGTYRFIHCTVANYMNSTFNRKDASFTLVLANATTDTRQTYPLDAGFDNCIIDGARNPGTTLDAANGEIYFDITEGVDFSYYFNHCVMKMKADVNSDPAFNQVIQVPYERNKTYKLFRRTGGNANDYRFDFQLYADTVVGIGKADPAITALYPVDRLGTDRLNASHGPTIGAYEYVAEKEEED